MPVRQSRSPVLSPRHEMFAHLVAQGVPIQDATAQCGFAPSTRKDQMQK
jgi:hypothetical protein